MAYENIIYEVDEGIATVTFNRPKALNALNGALLAELSDALDRVAADEDIRVLVLTGAGDKAFVAGADISELATFNPLSAKKTPDIHFIGPDTDGIYFHTCLFSELCAV